jgi:hypothetical protein
MTDLCPCCEPAAPTPHWWIVTCRIAFDDEDSFFILDAPTEADAVRGAEQELRGERQMDGDDATDDTDQPDFYVNYVFDCGERKPALALCNL